MRVKRDKGLMHTHRCADSSCLHTSHNYRFMDLMRSRTKHR